MDKEPKSRYGSQNAIQVGKVLKKIHINEIGMRKNSLRDNDGPNQSLIMPILLFPFTSVAEI